MKDWTEGFGGFIDDLLNNKRGKRDMVEVLVMKQLKMVFKLFFAAMQIGVKVMEVQDGISEEYGVYLVASKDDLNKCMKSYDPDWRIFQEKPSGAWKAEYSYGDGNPEHDIEKELDLNTDNFNQALRSLFSIFKEQFFDDIASDEEKYMKCD